MVDLEHSTQLGLPLARIITTIITILEIREKIHITKTTIEITIIKLKAIRIKMKVQTDNLDIITEKRVNLDCRTIPTTVAMSILHLRAAMATINTQDRSSEDNTRTIITASSHPKDKIRLSLIKTPKAKIVIQASEIQGTNLDIQEQASKIHKTIISNLINSRDPITREARHKRWKETTKETELIQMSH